VATLRVWRGVAITVAVALLAAELALVEGRPVFAAGPGPFPTHCAAGTPEPPPPDCLLGDPAVATMTVTPAVAAVGDLVTMRIEPTMPSVFVLHDDGALHWEPPSDGVYWWKVNVDGDPYVLGPDRRYLGSAMFPFDAEPADCGYDSKNPATWLTYCFVVQPPTEVLSAELSSWVAVAATLSHTFYGSAGAETRIEGAFRIDWKQGPTASFDVSRFGPGVYQFLSTSTHSGGLPLVYEWDFGDGSTGGGAVAGHTYAKPGTYDVTHTVRDAPGNEDSVTEQVVVDAPALAVSVRRPGGATGAVQPGEELDLELVVSAASEGVGALSGLQFDGDALRLDPDRLELVGGPTPAIREPLRLTPGRERVYRYRVRTLATGRASVRSTLAGQDAAGRPVRAEHDGDIMVREKTLVVTVTADPAQIDQPEAADADPEPIDITVTINLTNNGDEDITDLNLRSFGAGRVGAGDLLPIRLLDGPAPDPISGFPLAALGPGDSRDVVAHFRATDDAEVDFSALATGAYQVGTVAGFGHARVSIRPKYLMEFDAKVTRPGSGTLLPAGASMFVKGTVRNLTSTAPILVGPLLPMLDGNAGLASFSVDGDAPNPRDLVPPEFFTLDPGESKAFSVRATTSYSDPRAMGWPPHGGTHARLQFTPWGIATRDDGTEVAVDGSNTKATNESLKHEVSIDDSIALPETSYLSLFETITTGAMEGVGNFIAALPTMLISAVMLPYTLLRATAEFQSEVWNSFTEEERTEVSRSAGYLAAKVLMRNADLGREKFKDVWDQANAVAFRTMTDAANEWETGDYLSTAEMYSKWSGEAVASVVVPAALATLAKSAKAAAALGRAYAANQEAAAPVPARIRAATRFEEVVPLLRQLGSGAELGVEELVRAFGISRAEAESLQAICERFKVLLVMRARAPETLALIRKFHAVFKPEALKIKAVNSIDVLFGYKKGDVGRLVFKRPAVLYEVERTGRPVSEIVDQVLARQGVLPGTPRYYQAVNRVALRIKEWGKWEKVYKQWSGRKWIDVGFNYRDNAIPGALQRNSRRYRGFRMRPVGPAGQEEYVLEITDRFGKLRSVVGDIDGAAFTHLDGSPLSAEEHLALLRAMGKDTNIRLQHPESGTYFEGGLEFLDAQMKGEPGVQFAPGQPPRAVRFNSSKSRWSNPRDYHLHFDGGVVHAGGHAPAGQQPSMPNLQALIDNPPAPVADTFASTGLPGLDGGGPASFGRCLLTFSSAADARILGVDVNGAVSEYTLEDGWRPTDLGESCWRSGPVMHLTVRPWTTLVAGAATGAPRLVIDTDARYTPLMGVPEGFRIGDQIVINPGGSNEEVATVAGFGSIVLDEPTRRAHEVGEMVVATGNRVGGLADSGAGWVGVGADGGVFATGGAPFHGSLFGGSSSPPVAIDRTPTGDGYLVLTADGGVFAFGDAQYAGSLAGVRLDADVVDIALTPSGEGYVVAAADGGVFAFGAAAFHGSLAGVAPASPATAIETTPSGEGYILAAADGGVFAFGDAQFGGSMAGTALDGPVVDIDVDDAGGYLLAAADGGVFAFGGAVFPGSAAGESFGAPFTAIVRRTGGTFLIAGGGRAVALTPGTVAASLSTPGADPNLVDAA